MPFFSRYRFTPCLKNSAPVRKDMHTASFEESDASQLESWEHGPRQSGSLLLRVFTQTSPWAQASVAQLWSSPLGPADAQTYWKEESS